MVPLFRGLSLAALTCCVASGLAVTVPLKYVTAREFARPAQNVVRIASVKVADFDMLAKPDSPPLAEIKLGASDQGRNMSRFENSDTIPDEVAGVQCRRAQPGRALDFAVDDSVVFNGNKPDLYILVEYFDQGSTGECLEIAYDSADPSIRGAFKEFGATPFENSGTWKKKQFHVSDAQFSNRQNGGKSDFRILSVNKPSDAASAQTASFIPSGYQRITLSATPDSKLKLPDFKSSQPLFGKVELGDVSRWLALDVRNTSDPFYTVAYFDSNGNGDLTDDTPVSGTCDPVQPNSTYRSSRFSAVNTSATVGQTQLPYRFSLYAYYYGRMENGRLLDITNQLQCMAQGACGYMGEFELDGKKYKVLLGDQNINGRFGDVAVQPNGSFYSGGVPYLTGDQMYLAEGGRDPNSDDGLLLGEKLVLRDKVFNVSVDTAKQELTLEPTTEPLSDLKLSQAPDKMLLVQNAGLVSTPQSEMSGSYSPVKETTAGAVMLFAPGTQVKLPVGTYRLQTYSLSRSDEQGDNWTLAANGSTTPVLVKAGGAADLVYGEPYKPEVSGRITSGASSSGIQPQAPAWYEFWKPDNPSQSIGKKPVSLSFSLRGQGGDTVSDIAHTSGSATKIELSSDKRRPKQPTYKVLKTDGELVAQGKFEYG